MPAKFQETSFLVTYPQSTLSKHAVFNFFCALPSISFVKVCTEQHEDHGLHQHALVYFSSKQRFGERHFDIEGHHPNIKPVGKRTSDWTNVCDYLSKEDESPLEWGTPRHSRNIWSNVANASSRDEALQLIREEKPRDFIINRRQIDYALDSLFPVRQTTRFTPRSLGEFVLPTALDEWLLESF